MEDKKTFKENIKEALLIIMLAPVVFGVGMTAIWFVAEGVATVFCWIIDTFDFIPSALLLTEMLFFIITVPVGVLKYIYERQ